MKLVNIFYSAFTNSCPHCHQGKVFTEKNPFKLSKMFSLHKNCSHCNLRYEKEPSFFYGAMYVSYALTSGWFIVWFFINKYLLELNTLNFALIMVLSIIILSPLTLRLSRMLWLNLFNKYNSKYSQIQFSHEKLEQPNKS